MVKRIARNIARGVGTTIEIAPSRKIVCRNCKELRNRTVEGSIQRDWENVGRTISDVFGSESRRYDQAKK